LTGLTHKNAALEGRQKGGRRVVKFAAFNVRCPYEVGDKIQDEKGKEYTITDIMTIHSVKQMRVKFVYELDNSGKLINLVEPMKGRPEDN